MPPPDSPDPRRSTTTIGTAVFPPYTHLQHPCPRCDSVHTKFCYYNNYNLSQPRHFCKSCRRYWTHGGTLRDIPVGGGLRKGAKRSRTVNRNHSSSSTTDSASSIVGNSYEASPPPPAFVQLIDGSYGSLMSTAPPTGVLALDGFGLGLGHNFEEMGFRLESGIWPFGAVGDSGTNAGVHGNGSEAVTENDGGSWQYQSGVESTFGGGDCLAWPDLAISSLGNLLK